jgi:hypothetical protein
MGDVLEAKPVPDVSLDGGGSDIQFDPDADEAAYKAELAEELTLVSGTADEADAKLVEAELVKMPAEALELMRDHGVRVVVCRNDVLEVMPELADDKPSGWDEGSTWAGVPGMQTVDEHGNKLVVIATRGHGTPAGAHVPANGEGHGCHNLVIHESFHAVDEAGGDGSRSDDPDFTEARDLDVDVLPKYERAEDEGGPAREKGWSEADDLARAQRESYAESAARYYGSDPADRDVSGLNDYWETNPLAGS